MKYCYSFSPDEDGFFGEYDSPEIALLEAKRDADGRKTCWIGRLAPAQELLAPSCAYIGDGIRDVVMDLLFDEFGELIDEDSVPMSQEQQRALGEHVLAWLRDNVEIEVHGVTGITEEDINV